MCSEEVARNFEERILVGSRAGFFGEDSHLTSCVSVPNIASFRPTTLSRSPKTSTSSMQDLSVVQVRISRVRWPRGANQETPVFTGVTVFNAIKKSGVQPGEMLGISGAGGLGQLAIQTAKSQGIKVLALDVDDAKLATAKELGADVTVNPKTEGDKTTEKVRSSMRLMGLRL